MESTPNLSIGTVQFGLDYGISNTKGQTTPSEVYQILSHSLKENINQLDTAFAYGTSETVLSQYEHISDFHITTKTPAKSDDQDHFNWKQNTLKAIEQSIDLFSNCKSLSILTHGENDLEMAEENWLYETFKSLKEKNIIEHFGSSLYEPSKIIKLKSKYPDITKFQIPFNLLDQRALNAEIQNVISQNKLIIDTRSTLLQGLFCMNEVPSKLYHLKPEFNQLKKWALDINVPLINAAFLWVFEQDWISNVVIGVNDRQQLESNITFAKTMDRRLQTPPKESKILRTIRPDLW